MFRSRGSLARLAGWTVAFVAAGYLGRATIIDGGSLSLVWPASGVAALWICTGNRRTWPVDLAVLAGAALVVNLTTGAGLALAALFALTNVVQVGIFVLLGRRWVPHLWGFGGDRALRRLHELGGFAAAATLACGMAALVGTVGMIAVTGSGDVLDLLVWWGRNAAGLVVIALAGLLFHGSIVRPAESAGAAVQRAVSAMTPSSPGRGIEVVALLLASTVLYAMVFGGANALSFAFLLLVPTFWVGIRFNPLGVTLHSLVSGAAAILFTLAGTGPFVVLDQAAHQAVIAQVFVIMTVVAGLSLAFSNATEREVSAELGVLLADSKHREAAVVAARDRAERLFQSAPHGIALMDPHGVLLHLNPALCDLLGRSERDLIGSRLWLFCHDSDDTVVLDHLRAVVEGDAGREETTWVCRTLDGGKRSVSLSSTLLRDADGPGEHQVLTNVVDISERIQHQEQLAHLAEHDPLTELANRRLFEEKLEGHLVRSADDEPRGAVLMLDLDHFKDVNDSLGHGVGDRLLVDLSRALRRRMRETDTIARLGGDEFAVLLPQADLASAEQVAAELVDLVRGHVAGLDGVQRRVTVSVGGVVIDAGDTAAGLLSMVDTMLYDAKEAGRDQAAVLDRRVHAQPQGSTRMMWAERIELALAHDDFELHLQPILDMGTGKVTGAEALLRMRHAGEIVMPGQFLPVAERTQSIVQLDRWVVRNAVELLGRLQAVDPHFRLSLNLSAKSVQSSEVEQEIRAAVAGNQVDPTGLILEITETAALGHLDEARGFIDRIRPLGCRFALDDFGAGFGSFSYFKHLPFDVVKIDGQFVDGCAGSAVDRAIISSVAQMAAELGKETVAEFVTDTATMEAIDSLGVNFAQGFHVGRPIPVDDFIGVMSTREQAPAAF